MTTDSSGAEPETVPEAARPGRLEMDVVESRVHERLFGASTRTVSIGRFVVLGSAGAGGMGVVFAAHDPELDRKVAIKLVATQRVGAGASAQARLVAEAQTMARLSHPNIVTVHEVGMHDGGIWVAMEYVDGDTLARWVERERPPWRQILAAYEQAGQGLAAAHRAGVVHRDFKPSNAMIDRTGRVRVVDFGLAVIDAGAATDPEMPADDGGSHHAMAGTPTYMAPELVMGAPASVQSDVYAFCVSAWTAIFGVHPFARDDLVDTIAAMASGAVTPPPESSAEWVGRALERGLAPDPNDRWSTMDALLDALDRGRRRARMARMLAPIAALALGVAAFLGVRELVTRARTAACASAGASIAEVWNDDARADVRSAVLASEAGHAAVTAERVLARVDARADEWQHARTEACLDVDVRERWDEDTLERSLWCLDERRTQIESLVRGLSRGQLEAVQNGVSAAAALASVDACRDPAALARLPAPPVRAREEIREVRAQLGRVGSLEYAGRSAEGLAEARAALARARALEWAPLVAAAKGREAMMLEREGEYREAESAARDAYFEAAQVGAWDLAANIAGTLVEIVGVRQSRIADARAWSRHCEVALAHGGDPDGLGEARRLASTANVEALAGEHEHAIEMHERSLALRIATLGEDHPEVAKGTAQLADALWQKGDHVRAHAIYERAIASAEAAFGPDHPLVAGFVHNLGHVVYAEGDYPGARALYERALAILQRAGLRPDHPHVVNHRESLAIVLAALGEHREALAILEQTLAAHERIYGPDDPTVAMTLHNVAMVHFELGDYPKSLAAAERALAIEEVAYGPEHGDVASSLASIAVCLQELGQLERARTTLVRAVAISEKALGDVGHPELALALANLAGVHEDLGELAEARAAALRAIEIFDAHPGVQTGEPMARYRFAHASIELGVDRAQAIAQAHRAEADYRTLGPGSVQELGVVQAWLAEHAK